MIFHRHRDLPDVCESSRAMERAEEARQEATERWARIRSLASHMAALRATNHFIEGFRATLREKP